MRGITSGNIFNLTIFREMYIEVSYHFTSLPVKVERHILPMSISKRLC